ncbi:UDP-glucose 6-dehydrogenase, partial [Thermus scotoductus]
STDWPEYRTWPWERRRGLLRVPLVVDGRNFLYGKAFAAMGYRYVGVDIPALGILSKAEV